MSLAASQKDEVMEKMKKRFVAEYVEELLSKMTEKCFDKCIYKPGKTVNANERKCILMCTDRYLDSWNVVSLTYNARLGDQSHP